MNAGRIRVIFDLPPEIQMAIKLRAVKSNVTTGEVVEQAINYAFPEECWEAADAIRELERLKGQPVEDEQAGERS